MKITSIILCFCILAMSVQFAFAQTDVTFKVNTLVSNGKKSKEEASRLVFSENSVLARKRGKKTVFKEFNYAEIVGAEYSYSKKPVFSTAGAILATAILGVIAVPFYFMQKKQYWISIRTADDYLVLRLEGYNYKKILNEFEKHKVGVKLSDENEDPNDQKKN